MRLRKTILAASLVLSGCGTAVQHRQLTRPVDGYDALTVRQTVVLGDYLFNEHVLMPGTILVADEAWSDGVERFCGPTEIRHVGMFRGCIRVTEEGGLAMSSGRIQQPVTAVPAGAFVRTKM